MPYNIIDSGPGGETLTGTAAADLFRYDSLDDSRAAHPDTIVGFGVGDLIDISAVDFGAVRIDYDDPDLGGAGTTSLSSARTPDLVFLDRVIVQGTVFPSDLRLSAGTGVTAYGPHRVIGTDTVDVLYDTGSSATLIGGKGGDFLFGSLSTNYLYTSLDDSRVGFKDLIEGSLNPIGGLYRSVIDLTAVSGSLVLINHRDHSVLFGIDSSGVFQDRIFIPNGDRNAPISVANVGAQAGAGYEIIADDAGMTLHGGAAADHLLGGAGDDVLDGGSGTDTLIGAGGADTFHFGPDDSLPAAPDFIRDFQHGVDHIDAGVTAGSSVQLTHAYGYSYLSFGSDGAYGFRQRLVAYGEVAASDIMGGANLVYQLTGTAGADNLYADQSVNVLLGGGGADYLASGGARTTFVYTALSDSAASAPDYIQGFRSGADRIDLSQVTGLADGYYDPFVVALAYGYGETFIGFAPDSSGAPRDMITVEGLVRPSDLVFGYFSVPVLTLYALEGSQTLTGLSAADQIHGGTGADVITGGGGADLLSGGGGADVFRYAAVGDSTPAAPDVIADFQHGIDKIDLRGVAGTLINIVHDGAGGSQVYFAPNGVTAGGAIVVHGDVEDADVLADVYTVFVDTGAFAALEGVTRISPRGTLDIPLPRGTSICSEAEPASGWLRKDHALQHHRQRTGRRNADGHGGGGPVPLRQARRLVPQRQ